MKPIAWIKIRNQNYILEQISYDFHQAAALNGKLSSGLFGGNIHFVTESTGDDHFLASLLSAESTPIEGSVKITDSATGNVIRTIQIHEAYIGYYSDEMYSDKAYGMKTSVSLLVTRMDINSVEMDRRKYFYHGWVQCPPEPPKPIGNENPYTPPQPLVTSVKGETTALPYQKVTYTVTGYNIGNVADSDRKRIKWKIAVDDNEQNLKETGEKIEIEMKPEWAGKTVSVMPYLKKQTKAVSAQTKVRLEAVVVYVNGYWNSGGSSLQAISLTAQQGVVNAYKFLKKLIAENVIGTERKRGYWSSRFIGNTEKYFKRKYKDWTDKDMDAIQSLFIDGANKWDSSGETRFNSGWAEAELLWNSWLQEKQVIDA